MKIEYKKPFWVKYKWEMNDFDDSQLHFVKNPFVTPFNKSDSNIVSNFVYEDSFSILCGFSIKNDAKKDTKAGIFGKAGQNFGLNFDYSIDSLVFEFRTINTNQEVKFHCIIMDEVNSKMIESGVTILVIKNDNKFIFYNGNDIIKTYEYDGDPLIEEYRDSPLYVGCLNPGAKDEKDRCHSEIEVSHLSIIKNNHSNVTATSLLNSEYYNLPMTDYYDDILCCYDFKLINNYGNVFDNSKYSHFLEIVPKEYVL